MPDDQPRAGPGWGGFPGCLGCGGGLAACTVLLWPFLIWHGTAGRIADGIWLAGLAPIAAGAALRRHAGHR
jgi:hypothetical protein